MAAIMTRFRTYRHDGRCEFYSARSYPAPWKSLRPTARKGTLSSWTAQQGGIRSSGPVPADEPSQNWKKLGCGTPATACRDRWTPMSDSDACGMAIHGRLLRGRRAFGGGASSRSPIWHSDEPSRRLENRGCFSSSPGGGGQGQVETWISMVTATRQDRRMQPMTIALHAAGAAEGGKRPGPPASFAYAQRWRAAVQ